MKYIKSEDGYNILYVIIIDFPITKTYGLTNKLINIKYYYVLMLTDS